MSDALGLTAIGPFGCSTQSQLLLFSSIARQGHVVRNRREVGGGDGAVIAMSMASTDRGDRIEQLITTIGCRLENAAEFVSVDNGPCPVGVFWIQPTHLRERRRIHNELESLAEQTQTKAHYLQSGQAE
jgi:hypothetical protein